MPDEIHKSADGQAVKALLGQEDADPKARYAAALRRTGFYSKYVKELNSQEAEAELNQEEMTLRETEQQLNAAKSARNGRNGRNNSGAPAIKSQSEILLELKMRADRHYFERLKMQNQQSLQSNPTGRTHESTTNTCESPRTFMDILSTYRQELNRKSLAVQKVQLPEPDPIEPSQ